MKKLLGIMVLGLLFSGNVYAECVSAIAKTVKVLSNIPMEQNMLDKNKR